MPHVENELSGLMSRIERLERQSRRWKAGAICLALAGGACLALGAADDDANSKTLDADRLILRDEAGTPRVEFGPDGFFVNNEKGKHRISIFSEQGDSGIGVFADDTYKRQASMLISEKLHWCGFNVNDDNGVNRALLLLKDGKPLVQIQDESGQPIFTQPQQ